MAMGVDHPRHDREPRAVDDVVAVEAGADLGDPAGGDADVGAAEFSRADVDEAVAKDELRQVPAKVATSAIAAVGISSSATCRGKPSMLRTGPIARATATSAT